MFLYTFLMFLFQGGYRMWPLLAGLGVLVWALS